MNRCLPRSLLATVLLLAGSTAGQDSLGRGDRLDRNPRVGSGGRNSPGRVEGFRSRNLLITGDVAGGRGFRGSVGYTAEDDFRGDLGSDDLFEFRARSALSDIRYQTFGHEYDAFRAGQDFGLVEYRRNASAYVGSTSLPIGFAAYGASRAEIGDDALTTPVSPLTESRLRVDRMLAGAMTAAQQDVNAQPMPTGQVYDAEGRPKIATFSGVRGLKLAEPAMNVGARGLTTYDLLRAGEDQQRDATTAPLGTPYAGGFAMLPGAAAPPPETPEAPRATSPRMNAILSEVAQRYASAGEAAPDSRPAVLKWLDRDFESLRRSLGAPPPADSALTRANIVKPPEAPDPSATTTIRQRVQAQLDPDEEPLPGQMDLRDFSAVLRHGARIESLSEADASRFNELVSSGEERLRAGEFFQAERRFTRALRYTPGHPLAMAGVGHAQLASGLYLTSAMTLRSLLTSHPEMIDVRYGADVLPPPHRVDAALAALREMAASTSRPTNDRSAAGFLLAYLGHQREDAALVAEGLQVLRAANLADPLLPMLELVWLGEMAAAAPAALPAAGDPAAPAENK